MEIGVVLVTFNRLEKLKIALKSYEEQVCKPRYILIVNNNSSDGTKEYIEAWKNQKSEYEKYVVNLEKNTGGSGGFHEGIKRSLDLEANWVWVSDDDAFPEKDALKNAKDFLEKNKENLSEISAICGKIINNGKIDLIHRRTIYKGLLTVKEKASKQSDYEKESFELNAFSYVGSMMNKEKLKQIPITKKDYFIYFDDTDHSYRLSKIGKIICVPSIVIHHDVTENILKTIVSWKKYYGIRNMLDFIKDNFSKTTYKASCIKARIKYYAMVTILGSNKIEGYKIVNKAIKDAKSGKTGLDDKYKPGWNPTKE